MRIKHIDTTFYMGKGKRETGMESVVENEAIDGRKIRKMKLKLKLRIKQKNGTGNEMEDEVEKSEDGSEDVAEVEAETVAVNDSGKWDGS